MKAFLIFSGQNYEKTIITLQAFGFKLYSLNQTCISSKLIMQLLRQCFQILPFVARQRAASARVARSRTWWHRQGRRRRSAARSTSCSTSSASASVGCCYPRHLPPGSSGPLTKISRPTALLGPCPPDPDFRVGWWLVTAGPPARPGSEAATAVATAALY